MPCFNSVKLARLALIFFASTSLFFGASLATSSTASAKGRRLAATLPPDSALSPERLRPIDALQERLFKVHKSKNARSLKQAYQALQEGKLERAKKLTQPILTDMLFGDYALWITAQALRQE